MTTSETTIIYGAGRMGREVLAHRREDGREPAAFVDREARPGQVVDGLRVIGLDDALGDVEPAEVVIALHNPGVDVAALVDSLAFPKSTEVLTLWDECRRSGWLPRSPFWLDPAFDWEHEEEAIGRARSLLADDASRTVFDQQIALRRFGDYRGLAAPTPDDQYMPSGLPPWRQPMRLLDCGAFDGDTIRAMRGGGHAIERYVALEPDVDNHARLVARHGDDVEGSLLPVGASDGAGRLSFSGGEGGAAHVAIDGATTIDVVRIDDLCAEFRPTLIKMDIEGAERPALDGAAMTICRDRPDLAVSVYHRPDDLWRIPLQIDALQPGYRLHLRSHAFSGFDTVLYALRQ